jgi:ubiquinone/menaquinone biosynthesis C-methylase UbiE
MMRKRSWLGLTVLTGGAYLLYRHEQEKLDAVPPLPAEEAQALVERALSRLRLPTAPDLQPELAFDTNFEGKFIGLRCPRTHRIYPYRDRVLDLLEREPPLTPAQRSLNGPFTSWAYDRLRASVLMMGLLPFAQEAAAVAERLRLGPGDEVLDLCCGPGNFTVEWAHRVGPQGLVIGLDLSAAMLRRAAYHAYQAGLGNVLLIRGDAQALPFADGAFSRVNCSGGLHQLPDLPRALREIARVSRSGATLCASTFASTAEDRYAALKDFVREAAALHFVSLERLGSDLERLGYIDPRWEMAGRWFGYLNTQKA